MIATMSAVWSLKADTRDLVDPRPGNPFLHVNELLDRLDAESKGASRPKHGRALGKKKRKPTADSKMRKSVSPVETYAGSGSTTTHPLSVRAPWHIAWKGRDVFFFLKRVDGTLVHGNGGNRSGTLVIDESGRFYFDVIARGKWAITVARG